MKSWNRWSGGKQSGGSEKQDKTLCNDVYSLSMSWENFGGGMHNADFTAIESGEYIFLDNDIMMTSKEENAPVPFTITAKAADGNVVATGEFSFDANVEKLYLTVTADGRIMEDKDFEG